MIDRLRKPGGVLGTLSLLSALALAVLGLAGALAMALAVRHRPRRSPSCVGRRDPAIESGPCPSPRPWAPPVPGSPAAAPSSRSVLSVR